MKYRLLPSVLALLLVSLPAGSAQAASPVQPVDALLLNERTFGEGAFGNDVPGAKDDENASYTLSAAYPNPFRTRTQFDLRVKQTQRVSVEVYNILGQRVRTLYEGLMRNGDARTFTIEARGLPSGLYLYRVRGEHFTAARRVTLVQ
jgi:hypothetical protein